MKKGAFRGKMSRNSAREELEMVWSGEEWTCTSFTVY